MESENVLEYLKVELNVDEEEENIGIDSNDDEPEVDQILCDNQELNDNVILVIDNNGDVGSVSNDGTTQLLSETTNLLSHSEENGQKSVFPSRGKRKMMIDMRAKMNSCVEKAQPNLFCSKNMKTPYEVNWQNGTKKEITKDPEPEMRSIPQTEGGKKVKEVFVKLKVPQSVVQTPDFLGDARDIQMLNREKQSVVGPSSRIWDGRLAPVLGVFQDRTGEQDRRLRKIDAERQRRAGLAKLFDDLDFRLEQCDDNQRFYPKSLKPQKGVPYGQRITAAIQCIKLQEWKIMEKESQMTRLQIENIKLGKRLKVLKKEQGDSPSLLSPKTEPTPLDFYKCDICPSYKQIRLSSLGEAFKHEQLHHPDLYPDITESSDISSRQAELVQELSCSRCPMVCGDKDLLFIHSLLHLDLTYFFCPDCPFLFGLPSKLKRHMFLVHGKLLASDEAGFMVSMARRVKATRLVMGYMAKSDPYNVTVVENFIEASMDAKLILDEIVMSEELDEAYVSEDTESVDDSVKNEVEDVSDDHVSEPSEETDMYSAEEIDNMEGMLQIIEDDIDID